MDGNEKKSRYVIIDDMRGLILISMVVYHTVWNMVNLFGARWHWYLSDWTYLWQQSICWGFVLLSGFCWPLGQKKWKRGLTVFAAGLIVSVATDIFMPENSILFGVLTCLGSCMLFMIPLHKITSVLNPQIGLIASFGMFVLLRNINGGSLGFGHWNFLRLPPSWYDNLLTAYFGFPPEGFYSADYFSLFPWMFLFLTGYFIYRIVEKKEGFFVWRIPAKSCAGAGLEWLGKHSLLVYLLHQPLLYVVLCIFFK